MNETEIIDSLKKISGVCETYRVIGSYKFVRESKNGNSQTVRVDIFDAGEDAHPDRRYHCSAKSDDGTSAAGNPDKSVQWALSNMHWEHLDWNP